MTDELVKRLRNHTCDCFNGNTKHLTWKAADEIERLKEENKSHVDWISDLADNLIKAESKMSMQSKEIERLREALHKWVKFWKAGEDEDDFALGCFAMETTRSALQQKESE